MNKPTIEALLEGVSKKFFTNEDTDKYAFEKLSPRDKAEVAAQATINEFASVMAEGETAISAARDTLLAEDATAGFKADNAFNEVYFKKVLASGGDITKTPNYANGQILIKYSLDNANASPAFIEKMGALQLASENMVKYKDYFIDAIKRELHDVKEDTKRIVTQYYVNMVLQLDVAIDVLYSSSLRANIDFTSKPAHVKSVYFECKDNTLTEALTNLHYFNSLAITGKLRSITSKESAEGLLAASSRVLTENVLDVAFALLTTNKWADMFLLPLYAMRFVVYAVKYMIATYKKMTFSFDTSVEMIRKKTVSEPEFAAYQEDAGRKLLMVEQATHKAAADTARDVADNKEAFKQVSADAQAANSSVML
jgi:hypothetical protein